MYDYNAIKLVDSSLSDFFEEAVGSARSEHRRIVMSVADSPQARPIAGGIGVYATVDPEKLKEANQHHMCEAKVLALVGAVCLENISATSEDSALHTFRDLAGFPERFDRDLILGTQVGGLSKNAYDVIQHHYLGTRAFIIHQFREMLDRSYPNGLCEGSTRAFNKAQRQISRMMNQIESRHDDISCVELREDVDYFTLPEETP